MAYDQAYHKAAMDCDKIPLTREGAAQLIKAISYVKCRLKIIASLPMYRRRSGR